MGLKTTADLLREARDLITPFRGWTQGELARDAHGRPCSPNSPAAVCWCGTGAAMKVDGKAVGESAFHGLCRAAAKHNIIIPRLNDGGVTLDGLPPHEAILRLYDEAIALAEANHDAP
ncbi:DUF6197 family protein [Methylobacterium indicum]|uniref:DUF6197 family protein n=1 Tax=Methylobacterium indicum TaxID=1775910 RepID=UPI000A824396|nr:hypothetical protein [Methylobacterium indicum]